LVNLNPGVSLNTDDWMRLAGIETTQCASVVEGAVLALWEATT
jgi:hypothetical protein